MALSTSAGTSPVKAPEALDQIGIAFGLFALARSSAVSAPTGSSSHFRPVRSTSASLELVQALELARPIGEDPPNSIVEEERRSALALDLVERHLAVIFHQGIDRDFVQPVGPIFQSSSYLVVLTVANALGAR